MTIFLQGLASSFYRGIGSETQFICPFSRLNLFIGANNSGKSIVLDLIADRISKFKNPGAVKNISKTDEHMSSEPGKFELFIGRNFQSLIQEIINSEDDTLEDPRTGVKYRPTDEFLKLFNKISINNHLWIQNSDTHGISLLMPKNNNTSEYLNWGVQWQMLWRVLTSQTGGTHHTWIPAVFKSIAHRGMPSLPSTYLIPAKRVLGGSDEEFDDLSGKGLIDRLAILQNPDWNNQADREKFEKINKFLQEVIGKPNAELKIPHGNKHIIVHIDDKVLPLKSLGTGIHEVILIASFCIIHDNSIMCIEEPEIHLHPLLQRKLVTYLLENTNSQYFIATHSSSFINIEKANIFMVTNDGVKTRIKSVITRSDQRSILDELGYHASDILQSNAVIWVEGPSDRIYLNHWIKSIDKSLIESIHYTIMFYGGSLVKHLSANDEALIDFIKLRDLNRNMAIILDSDRESPTSELKPHAQRILQEVNKDGGMAWITAGREVENYVDGNDLQLALKKLHPKLYVSACPVGQFDHAFYFMRNNPKKPNSKITYKNGDKVGAATLICSKDADLDILDLRARISDLVCMIKKSNGMLPDSNPK